MPRNRGRGTASCREEMSLNVQAGLRATANTGRLLEGSLKRHPEWEVYPATFASSPHHLVRGELLKDDQFARYEREAYFLPALPVFSSPLGFFLTLALKSTAAFFRARVADEAS